MHKLGIFSLGGYILWCCYLDYSKISGYYGPSISSIWATSIKTWRLLAGKPLILLKLLLQRVCLTFLDPSQNVILGIKPDQLQAMLKCAVQKKIFALMQISGKLHFMCVNIGVLLDSLRSRICKLVTWLVGFLNLS